MATTALTVGSRQKPLAGKDAIVVHRLVAECRELGHAGVELLALERTGRRHERDAIAPAEPAGLDPVARWAHRKAAISAAMA
jgi:hypothetical protein